MVSERASLISAPCRPRSLRSFVACLSAALLYDPGSAPSESDGSGREDSGIGNGEGGLERAQEARANICSPFWQGHVTSGLDVEEVHVVMEIRLSML